jgi:hypothetical protein
MVGFEKIMKNKSQWDNPDPCRDDPHTKGAENLNILYGCRVAAHWLWGAARPPSCFVDDDLNQQWPQVSSILLPIAAKIGHGGKRW